MFFFTGTGTTPDDPHLAHFRNQALRRAAAAS